MVAAFLGRYSTYDTAIVSNPDSELEVSTQNDMLEQTFEATAKAITGVTVPYTATSNFNSNVELRVVSDDNTKVLAEVTLQKVNFTENAGGNLDFNFPRTTLKIGQRYRIQLDFLNADQKGTLKIPSGTNYGGCTLSGTDTMQASAFTLHTVKFSKLFWLMAVLLPLFGVSMVLMIITGRKWEETVAVSLFTEGIILYVFGCKVLSLYAFSTSARRANLCFLFIVID